MLDSNGLNMDSPAYHLGWMLCRDGDKELRELNKQCIVKLIADGIDSIIPVLDMVRDFPKNPPGRGRYHNVIDDAEIVLQTIFAQHESGFGIAYEYTIDNMDYNIVKLVINSFYDRNWYELTADKYNGAYINDNIDIFFELIYLCLISKNASMNEIALDIIGNIRESFPFPEKIVNVMKMIGVLDK